MSTVRVSDEALSEDLAIIANLVKSHPEAAYDEEFVRVRDTILDLIDARAEIVRLRADKAHLHDSEAA